MSSTEIILFDEGATKTFIKKELADKLNLKPIKQEVINLAVFGNDESTPHSFDIVKLRVQTQSGQFINIKAVVVPQISTPINNLAIQDLTKFPYLRKVRLAHPPTSQRTSDITILIGADYYWEFVQDHIIRGNGPTAVQSKLGYLLSGPCYHNTLHLTTSPTLHVMAQPTHLDDMLTKFWDLESIGISHDQDSKNEDYNLTSFQNKHIEKREDQYVAKLPWKTDHPPLPTNYNNAYQRTRSLVRKLPVETRHVYHRLIKEQEARGFIEKVNNDDSTVGHYLPHHAVKKDSITTPIRIVYDCSAKATHNQPSLNECLLKGPPLLNDLTGILLRFRIHNIALTSDIEKAFLNIGLHESDRDFTKFLWLEDPQDIHSKFVVYRFSSVLFGSVSSPAILNAVIRTHLDKSENEIANLLKNDIYVDNIVSGTDNSENAVKFYKESNELLESAGFRLRSWASNDTKINAAATQDNVQHETTTAPLLGMKWDTVNDQLLYKEIDESDNTPTKRSVIRHVSRIYDPLRYLSPVLIQAKVFMQDLWKRKLEWDEQLSPDLQSTWNTILKELNCATTTMIPRKYFDHNNRNCDEYEIHCFTDASLNKGYGAAIYITRANESSLVMAKSRVAPLKPHTIPRMELMGVVLGTRLTTLVKEQFKQLTITQTTLWTDSLIVLSWIRSMKPLPTFVHNRVTEIKAASIDQFKYCPTQQNPADLLTRGVNSTQFQQSELWWKGPTFLTTGNHPPEPNTPATALLQQASNIDEGDDKHSKSNSTTNLNIAQIIDVTRYSSLNKLLRITAYVVKATEIMRKNQNNKQLTASDLNSAERLWIHAVQQHTYADEIQQLQGAKIKTTLVRQLQLFLDDDKLLHVNGRLHNAPVDYDTKFPVLLPRQHAFTTLMIRQTHQQVMHSGVQATVAHLRQRFWITQVRSAVKSVLHHCVICKRLTGKPYISPPTPPLPSCRVQNVQPFTTTGIDYTGHLFINTTNGQEQKVYICIFTCATTRATHLEIVQNLSTKTFINAFRRFTARRGIPSTIISDNATTFIAASNEIAKICAAPEVQEYMLNTKINWKFIVKRAPWMGGFYERIVGMTKSTLQKVLGKSRINLEELTTLITEVEATLNDRPLTYISDGVPFTPSHLMCGRPLKSLPHAIMDDTDYHINEHSIIRQATHMNNILQHFKQRWQKEYITALRERHLSNKTKSTDKNIIKVGDIVLVHTDNKKRIEWPLAKVTKLFTGLDNYTRSAEIKTKQGTTQRPITKLYPLEVNGESINDTTQTGTDQKNTKNNVNCRQPCAAAIKAKKAIAAQANQNNDLDS